LSPVRQNYPQPDSQHCPQQKLNKENSWFGELAVLAERKELYPKAFKSFKSFKALEEIPYVAIFDFKNYNFFPTLKVFGYYLQKPGSRSGILIHHEACIRIQ
jgi:hypothetical protein